MKINSHGFFKSVTYWLLPESLLLVNRQNPAVVCSVINSRAIDISALRQSEAQRLELAPRFHSVCPGNLHAISTAFTEAEGPYGVGGGEQLSRQRFRGGMSRRSQSFKKVKREVKDAAWHYGAIN